MKFIATLFLLIAAVTGGAYYLLFTPGGNDTLKPFLNDYLAAKSKTYDLKLTAFRLTPSAIDANITLNQSLNTHISGDLNLFSQRFDLNYTLFAKTFKIENFLLNETINLKGKIQGTPKQIALTGAGKAINSNLKYSLKTDHQKLHDIRIDIDRGNLKSFLLLAGQKPYLLGHFNLHVDMPGLDTQNPTGKASLLLKNGKADTTLIRHDFNITLPQDFRYSVDLRSRMKGAYASLDGKITTTLANLFLKNGKLYPKSNKAELPYLLDIPNLSKLEPITGRKLRGSLKSKGIAAFDKRLKISGNTQSLGGDIAYLLHASKLNTKITSVPLTNILHTLIVPEILEGMVFGDVTYDLTAKKGKVDTKMQNVRLLPNQVTEILKTYASIDLTKERYNQTTFTADLNDNTILFNFNAKSKKSYITVKEGLITRDTNTIDAKFAIQIHGKDFTGTLKGDLKKPKVKLDSSKYLKQKAVKEINRFIDKKISDKTKQKVTEKLKKFGLGDSNASNPEDALKGLIKGLF